MEKKYYIGTVINTIFIIVGLVAAVMSLVANHNIVGDIVDIVLYLLIILYAFWGYKRPHGNILKELMLFYGVSMIINLNFAIMYDQRTNVVMTPILMMLIAYIAGTLDNIKVNRFLMVAVLLGVTHCSMVNIIKTGGTLGFATNHVMMEPMIIWIVLCGAYFTRYIQRKEEGITVNK